MKINYNKLGLNVNFNVSFNIIISSGASDGKKMMNILNCTWKQLTTQIISQIKLNVLRYFLIYKAMQR